MLLRGGIVGGLECAVADMSGVFLDALEQVERGERACGMPPGLQAHPHDAIEDECREVDQGGEPARSRCRI